MSSYIQNTLISDEKVIYEAKISKWSLLPLILLGFFIAIYSLIIGLIPWIIAVIRYNTTELAFTNKRVIAKFGFISRRTVEINLIKVESIQVSQSIIGRFFDFGTLIISGAGNPQAPIPGISLPMQFRRAFMEYQDKISK